MDTSPAGPGAAVRRRCRRCVAISRLPFPPRIRNQPSMNAAAAMAKSRPRGVAGSVIT